MNKTAIITGASGGIGEATCLLFAKNGYNIVYQYNSNKNEKLAEKLSGLTNCLFIKADFLVEKEVYNLYAEAVKTFGKIDCLVNNAGKPQYGLIIDENYKTIEDTFKVNTISPMYLTSLVSKNMIKNNGGNIIFVSSIYSRFGSANESVYSTTKSAFTGLTSALSSELSSSNIRVNCVAPGAVDTAMNKSFNAESQADFFKNSSIKRMATPSEIAKVIYFLASADSSYINGQTIYVDGGLNQY